MYKNGFKSKYWKFEKGLHKSVIKTFAFESFFHFESEEEEQKKEVAAAITTNLQLLKLGLKRDSKLRKMWWYYKPGPPITFSKLLSGILTKKPPAIYTVHCKIS